MKTLGRITRTHGFEGAVVVKNEGITGRVPEPGEPVFIITDGIPVPFFIHEISVINPDTVVISFDYYETPESVAWMKGCEVSHEITGVEEELTSQAGYTITDPDSRFTGLIKYIRHDPGQLMAVVSTAKGEVLIPMHPDLIRSVDHKRKIITMSLPQGIDTIND